MHERLTRLANAGLRHLPYLSAVCLLMAAALGPAAATGSASTAPSATDVMLVFDTSESTSSELAEAKEKIQSVVAGLAAALPNAAFGVSRVEDVPGWTKEGFAKEPSQTELEAAKEKAWQLMQPISTSQAASVTAVDALQSGSGGDDPEAYGRALWEADTNPNVGWRAGARHEIVLIADNVPHDPDLNEGVPPGDWAANQETHEIEDPFDTGTETPGKDGIPGTVWVPGTDLRIVSVAKKLAADGKPLEEVEFFGGESGYLPYWEYWASLSGGTALEGVNGELAPRLTTLIEDGACAGKCPDPTTAQVTCSSATTTAACTATIVDASTTGPSIPSGAVGFASADGGSFPSGASCTLTAAPAPADTSSCSVAYLPPTVRGTTAVITATYTGDGGHAGSSAQTSYSLPAEPEARLAPAAAAPEVPDRQFRASRLGDFTGSEVEVPFECGFSCELASGLYSGPSLATISSLGTPTFELAEIASGKPKKKAPKPKLIGTGTAKLEKAGKGVLRIKIARRYQRAFAKIKGTVKLTLKLQSRTLAGTVVGDQTVRVTLKRKQQPKRH